MDHRLKSLFILMIVVLFAAVLSFQSGWAQAEGFSESFDGTQLEGWEHSPEVVVADGVLRISPGNFALRPGDWSSITLTVNMRYDNLGETFILYHFQDENHYALRFIESEIVLDKVKAGAGQPLGHNSGAGLQANTWMEIQIAVSDGQHQISIDGETVITASDAEMLPGGAILLQSHGERTTEFDDLVVSGQSGAGGLPGGAQPGGEPLPGEPVVAPPLAPGQGAPATGGAAQLGGLLSGGGNIDMLTVAINLALSALAAFILGRIYIHWGYSLSNRRRFAANFMLVTLTTTFIILVVRSSVALSLGLVGALSIVRFRTAIKEPEELAYLFAAIGIGVGLGDNQRLLTLLALALMVLVVALMRLFRQSQSDINLHLGITSYPPEKIGIDQVTPILEQHCAKLRLLRYDENSDTLEMSFVIEFRRSADLGKLRSALQELSGALEISFLDNKGVW